VTDFASCLYLGEVVHKRFVPVVHRLRYRMFQMLFDLDELPRIDKCLCLFSYNKFGPVSFHDSDHGDGTPLRAYIETILSRSGLSPDGGRIEILCMPRIFGYVFNPISIYYCHDRAGNLISLIYEVRNTFGQKHTYLIPVEDVPDGVIRQSCDKSFHVSPFLAMDMKYDFKMTRSDSSISTIVEGGGIDGARLIFASFTARRRDLSDRALARVLVSYPFLTIGVVAAIHWEALKLFLKGVRLHREPPPPDASVSVIRATVH
jgi:DUF1365 family protein